MKNNNGTINYSISLSSFFLVWMGSNDITKHGKRFDGRGTGQVPKHYRTGIRYGFIVIRTRVCALLHAFVSEMLLSLSLSLMLMLSFGRWRWSMVLALFGDGAFGLVGRRERISGTRPMERLPNANAATNRVETEHNTVLRCLKAKIVFDSKG